MEYSPLNITIPECAQGPNEFILNAAQFEGCLVSALPGLMRYARSLARDHDAAQDLVQETAIRAWHARSRFVAGNSFKAWSYRILRNCFLSNVRRQRVAKTESRGDDLPDVPVAPDQETAVDLQDVARNWERLTADHQRSLTLVAIDGHSYEEAAAIENVPIGTLKSRVARARQMLLAFLTNEFRSRDDERARYHSSAPRQTDRDRLAVAASDEIDRAQGEILRSWREGHRGTPLTLAA